MRTLDLVRSGLTLSILATLLATAAPLSAFKVDNRTPYDIRVLVPQASEASWDDDDGEEVEANSEKECLWTNTSCSSVTEEGLLRRQLPLSATVLIEDSFGDMSEGKGLFTCNLPLRADGVLVVDVQERGHLNGTGAPYAPNVICTAYFREDVGPPGFNSFPVPCSPVELDLIRGSLVCPDVDVTNDGVYSTTQTALHWTDPYSAGRDPDSLPEMRTANRQDLEFFVTGDPQFDNGHLDPDESDYQSKTIDASRMMDALIRSANARDRPEIRGVVVSGDLTQNARAPCGCLDDLIPQVGDELAAYTSSIRVAPWFGFEGLGNHDVERGDNPFPISFNNPEGMIEYVAEKARGTIPTNRRDKESNQAPNYSWDWHDVHFVQLNVAPANGFVGDGGLMARDALAFLEVDLPLNVGSTGRPVVLFHHYGFDSFSIDGWWSEADRRAYWNVIAPYNVIGIFTGHRHYTRTSTSWRQPFVKPAGASADRADGRTQINAYVAGAALGGNSSENDGVALHVEINECNEMIISRVGEVGSGGAGLEPASGTTDDEETVTFTTTGWGDPATTCVGVPSSQTISFPALSDVTYGAPDVPLAATATSGLPVSYSSTGSCTVVGSTAVINGAGVCTITASQPGDATWDPAPDAMQSFTVFKATPTVSVSGGTFQYDGTPRPATGSVTGVFGEDLGAPTMDYTPGGASAPVDVGTYSVLASFAGDANYEPASNSTSISITPITLSAAITAADKVYDGTATATILTRTAVGVLPGEDVTLVGGAAAFDDANVGTGKLVTGSGFALGGADAGNYFLPAGTTATTTADITPAELGVAITAANKIYDATTAATILTRTPVGVIGGDVVTVEGGTATFADPNAGVGKLVTGSGFTLGGADAGNYFLSDGTTATTTADITPAQTTTTVVSSLNPSVFGQNVMFTATVAPVAPGGGVPLGSVQFVIDSAPVGTIALTGGQATFPTALLGAGLHTIQANYLGHPNHTSSGGTLGGGQQVLPFAVTGTVTASPNAQQYSDEVTFSLSLPNPNVNGQTPIATSATGTFVLGSPDQTMGTCALAAGAPMTCVLANEPLLETVAGAMAAGVHSASINFPTAAFNPNYAVTLTPGALTIQHEDATVTPDASNPSAVLVASDGGDSPEFSLVAEIQELVDGSLGDISLAELSCTLSPVGPGGGASVAGVLDLSGPPAAGGPVTATCTFPAGVGVNVYSVDYSIGGNYYRGSAQETLTVYDPSLGFATGGGWFYWPGTADGAYLGDKTNFGFHLKFNKKGTNVQGGLLVIRHRADGTIVRLKSNAMDGFAIGDAMSFGWATADGKANYINQQTMTDPVGNQQFLFYAEDHNEPGTGVDRFWVQAPTTDGELSLPADAADQAVEISGGNIAIPHGTGGGGNGGGKKK